MEGALLRSLLDIDCLNSLSLEQSTVNCGGNAFSGWEDVLTPVLSLDDSIDLIRRIGLDSNLLSLLGLETNDTGLKAEQDGPNSERDINTEAHVGLDAELHTETELELETTQHQDLDTQVGPDEDQKEQALEHPSEVGSFQIIWLVTSQ